jgi:hypothetical protein
LNQYKAQKNHFIDTQPECRIENNRAIGLLELLILKSLPEKKCMSKQAGANAIKAKNGIELTQEAVDSLLDNLWFEELIYTEGTSGKRYGLTKKGTKIHRSTLKGSF